MRKHPDVITDVSKYQRGWAGGLPETQCGFGSRVAETGKQRDFLHRIVKDYGIKTVADIGAGDLNWIQHMQWGVQYQGYDLVPRHPDVQAFNLLEEVPPKSDLLMCIWVLNHFTEDQAQVAFRHLMQSRSRYLVMTYDSRHWDFLNVAPVSEIQIRPPKAVKGNIAGHNGVFLRLIRC